MLTPALAWSTGRRGRRKPLSRLRVNVLVYCAWRLKVFDKANCADISQPLVVALRKFKAQLPNGAVSGGQVGDVTNRIRSLKRFQKYPTLSCNRSLKNR